MKIAILGAGFTGLTAALKLAAAKHEVTVFEKESREGGLAAGFKEAGWDWYLDQSYHHFFTNDNFAISLAKEVGTNLIRERPKTAVLVNKQILPFDSPLALLKFPHLPLTDRLRVGFLTFYLKYLSTSGNLSNKAALPWLKKYMGGKVTDLIWEPLFLGKFGTDKDRIALNWFWARIKKRSASLLYPEGGFQQFAENIKNKAARLGVKFIFNTEVNNLKFNNYNLKFDRIIVTLPTPIFIQLANFSPSYIKCLNSIPHLTAQNLVLILKKPFFKDQTYWLNITDKSFPFLVLAEHTNFMDPKNYGNQHILYIGNYLPENHPYLKKSTAELLKIFEPYLKKLNTKYEILNTHKFILPNAQPIVTPNYQKLIPGFRTPLKNVYLANMDMVYPWDRGVNYAIELGEKIADRVHK